MGVAATLQLSPDQEQKTARSPWMHYFKILLFFTIVAAFGTAHAEGAWKQNKFMITFWSPPPAATGTLAAAKNEGFNLTWTYEAGLDIVRGQGMTAMLQDSFLFPSSLDDPGKRLKLDALIARVKNHAALEAYYLADEPNASTFASLGRLVAYLRVRDPNHFAYINLYPVYATNAQLGTNGPPIQAYREYLRRFIEIVKPSLISYDHYHFLKHGDGDQYFLNLELIREAAVEHGLPFLNIIQASTIEKTWRLVNPNELRWLVYTTLAYGGRGISYFLYWGPPAYGGLYQNGIRTPLVDAVTVLNRELAAQSTLLMDLDCLGVFHTAPLPIGTKAVPASSPVKLIGPGNFVMGLFGKNDQVTTFMVVNRNYVASSTARIAVSPEVQGIEEFDRTNQQWRFYRKAISGQDIIVPLNPGDGKLYRFVF